MSRYSTLKLDNPTPTTNNTSSKSTTKKVSKTTRRCECCGREMSISHLTPKNYDSITRRATLVCSFCERYYDRGTLDRYSYDISQVPVSWLTYSYNKKEAK